MTVRASFAAMAFASVWTSAMAAVLAVELAAQDPAAFAAAVADYRAGKHEAAFAAFQAQFAAAGDAAGDALRWNLALAALRLQRSGDAEAAVAPWLAGGDDARRADGEFVLGMAGAQRSELAAAAAQLPDAEPLAWAMAIRAMEQAADAFVRAAAARGGWPEAERNAARTRARVEELKRLRDAAREQAAKKASAPKPLPPAPQPKPDQDDDPLGLVTEPLPAKELPALARRIAQRDQKKVAVRREQQQKTLRAGERGW
jgi:hypothetical protein